MVSRVQQHLHGGVCHKPKILPHGHGREAGPSRQAIQCWSQRCGSGRNKAPCHDGTNQMNLNIFRIPRDSSPRTPNATTMTGEIVQELQTRSGISEPRAWRSTEPRTPYRDRHWTYSLRASFEFVAKLQPLPVIYEYYYP